MKTNWRFLVHILQVVILLACVALTTPCLDVKVERVFTQKELYNPLTDPIKCGRRWRSWLCDPAKFVCDDEGDDIDSLANEVRVKTDCPCEKCSRRSDQGYKFAVAVLPKILHGHESEEEKEQVGQSWALYFKNITNFGHCGEEVILIWSVADHKVWAYTGYTTKKNFFYEKCTSEILKGVHEFECSGDPGKGVKWVMNEMRDVFVGLRCNFLDWPSVKILLPTGVVLVLYAVVFIYYCFDLWLKNRARWTGNHKKRDTIL